MMRAECDYGKLMSENYDVYYPSGKVFKEDGSEVTHLLKTVILDIS